MAQFILTHGGTMIAAGLSLLAVLISLFRARAHQTEAAAAAVTELTEVSQDLRERITHLESQNRHKNAEIRSLRKQAAQITVLEAQVRYLSEELARVRGRYTDERERLLQAVEARDNEIKRLREVITGAGLALPA